MILDDNGKERLLVDGRFLGNPKGLGRLGAVGARDGSVPADTVKYADGCPGGVDPHVRIKDQDLDGIDAAFLYPSIGLLSGVLRACVTFTALVRAWVHLCQRVRSRSFPPTCTVFRILLTTSPGRKADSRTEGHWRRRDGSVLLSR